ncbi:MAG: immunoglobulin-like domain-containing protein [Candidatus Izemoplasmatales bacterium]|uniref:Atrophied bacterial Ig domain-containing protein n=1 Tax=Hujiaoplasma nucleasis TaxID=2725268 RepID=A0A7L6N6H3_9MOLU|nr:immunoglobulin-like domain-containing protein [Hujiaoplasma nucleasis]QLY40104.1 hypothetical protein HF295_04190 [Hujiaoplasma nucleasis]
MKSILTKRVIVIFSIILVITVGSVVLAFTLNNTNIPRVENGDEIVYSKLDDNGDVLYTITKQELFDEMKRNNGMNQILSILDESLLASYLDQISQDDIDERLEYLKYQTNDQEVIDGYSDDVKEGLEENYRQLIILSGYEGHPEDFAKILIARENFVRDYLIDNDEITESEIAEYYLNDYFEDIDAIRLRFLNKDDAMNILYHFNLAELDGLLTTYNGFSFKDESLKDLNGDIIEAQITIDTYYFHSSGDILDSYGNLAYDFDNEIYTNQDDDEFTLDDNGNLLDDEENIVIEHDFIFTNEEDAVNHKEENTTYFKVILNNEIIEVYTLDDVLTYTVENDIIYDINDNDVTDSIDLRFNKEFTAIEDVKTFTSNNTSPLTEDEVLSYYIQMYNYIYGNFRTELDELASIEDLIALDNEYLQYNFQDIKELNSTLATYMFSDISQLNDKVYSAEPKTIGDYSYMVFKLSEGTKYDMKDHIINVIKQSIELPKETITDLEFPAEGPYDSTITWRSSKTSVIANNGAVTIPEEDSLVTLTYTIKVLGITQTGTVRVGVKASGSANTEIQDLVENDLPEITLTEMIGDDTLYNDIKDLVLEEKVNTSSVIDDYMNQARKAANFQVFDYYLSLDYIQNYDSAYEFKDGKDNTIASIDVDGQTIKLSAEQFYQRGLNRNPSLMIFYAAQFKEGLNSEYFQALFGSQKDIDKNNSDLMEVLEYRSSMIKQEYSYFVQNPDIYNYYKMVYGYNFNLDTYQSYLYTRYHIYNDEQLLQNLILGELRLSYVKDVLETENITDKIYSIVETNYENFFSLDTEHILVFFDFDEDTKTDDYFEYYDNLSASEQSEFDALTKSLETAIKESEDSLEDIVKAYENASRDDETWGEFKQVGIILKYESLNPTSGQGQSQTEESLTYKQVKNSFAEEFTAALIDLYNEYQNPLNAEEGHLLSNEFVETSFGLHLIRVEKGDDFDGISLKATEGVSDPLLNDLDKPSLSQIETYYTYKLYETFYDLDNVDVEDIYGIALPVIPNDMLENLNFYAEETLESIFGTYMVNYAYILEIQEGQVSNAITQAEFDTNMGLLLDIYYYNTIETLEE